jgi:cephalosporin-C deacetylase-like acetyl esterase
MLDPSSFAYAQQAPLALEIVAERVQNGALVRDITYGSPHGGKVPAYLILPAQQTPQAGLIFGHWGEGDRTEFVDEAIVLTRLGFVSLCLDAPGRRTAEFGSQKTQPQMELQWIVDVCRGVDVLLETFSLPPEHIGYVGHSYGATFGGVVAAPSHLFFQFAENDTAVVAEDGQLYFELASEPKQIAWYENCGHEFNNMLSQVRLEKL